MTALPSHLDTYEAIVDYAASLAAEDSRLRWELGDLTCLVVGDPVQGRPSLKSESVTLKHFAGAIGVGSNQLGQYRACAAFYPPQVRAQHDNLSWSHYNQVRRKTDNLLQAQAWLGQAASEGWTSDRLAAELKNHAARDLPPREIVHELSQTGNLGNIWDMLHGIIAHDALLDAFAVVYADGSLRVTIKREGDLIQ